MIATYDDRNRRICGSQEVCHIPGVQTAGPDDMPGSKGRRVPDIHDRRLFLMDQAKGGNPINTLVVHGIRITEGRCRRKIEKV